MKLCTIYSDDLWKYVDRRPFVEFVFVLDKLKISKEFDDNSFATFNAAEDFAITLDKLNLFRYYNG